MAIAVSGKTNEIQELKSQLQRLRREKEEKEEEMSEKVRNLESRLTKAEENERSATEETKDLKDKVKHAMLDVEEVREEKEKAVQSVKEDHADQLKVLESERSMLLRDLRTQLEIANAQKVEFEECVARLRQEAADLAEERKIAERKNAAASKDLRRQLAGEKARSDRLQERLVSIEDAGGSSPGASTSVDADRTSISSWSLMSGQNERASSTPPPLAGPLSQQHQPSSSPPNVESLPRDSPDPPRSASNADSAILLDKIGSLQEDRLVMEEKIHMLEHSSAAMAEDLMRKTTLIQYYCMDGGKSGMKLTHQIVRAYICINDEFLL